MIYPLTHQEARMAEPLSAIHQSPVDQARLGELRAAAGTGPVLILTHDNPDPDALASGKALAILFKEAWDIPSRLVYSGLVARAENRAMLNLLTPEWEHAGQLAGLDEYSAIAQLDTQPGAGNNSLPADRIPQIVLDHHQPYREQLQQVRFADVRQEIGATATILFEYLEAAQIEVDSGLATALFYGLKTDTRGLSRGASLTDERVYIKLLALLDRQKLIQLEQAGLPRVYFHAFNRGLHAAQIYSRSVVADLGKMHRPDLAAEMADLLIRLEGAQAVLCLGEYGQTLHLSIRTVPLGQVAGQLVQQIIIEPGRAGGHGNMAGGQVPLDGQDYAALVDRITGRFLDAMGETEVGEHLIGDEI
jgi:nanoRNase/pAp phosphatase (c-di-AMP/oligoRNAs hydrolase)